MEMNVPQERRVGIAVRETMNGGIVKVILGADRNPLSPTRQAANLEPAVIDVKIPHHGGTLRLGMFVETNPNMPTERIAFSVHRATNAITMRRGGTKDLVTIVELNPNGPMERFVRWEVPVINVGILLITGQV